MVETGRTIYFDMDGTLADLYGVAGWLDMLRSCDPTPYELAPALLHLQQLARILNELRRAGYRLGIVSWLAKESTVEYDKAVTKAKLKWLQKHLNSVIFDEIYIVPYGTPKYSVVKDAKGILFDDEKKNRDTWTGVAYDVNDIINTLKMVAM